jgi:hypothetical protein
VATSATASPKPIFSIGCGVKSRWKEYQMMVAAATRMSAPSMAAEKNSIF